MLGEFRTVYTLIRFFLYVVVFSLTKSQQPVIILQAESEGLNKTDLSHHRMYMLFMLHAVWKGVLCSICAA